MKIDSTTTSYPAVAKSQGGTSGEVNTSFSAALAAANAAVNSTPRETPAVSAGNEPEADFSNMTRGELQAWINERIRTTGTLDGTETFVSMTVNGLSAAGPLDQVDDSQRFDYLQILSSGIEGALSRNAMDEARRLQAALELVLPGSHKQA